MNRKDKGKAEGIIILGGRAHRDTNRPTCVSLKTANTAGVAFSSLNALIASARGCFHPHTLPILPHHHPYLTPDTQAVPESGALRSRTSSRCPTGSLPISGGRFKK